MFAGVESSPRPGEHVAQHGCLPGIFRMRGQKLFCMEITSAGMPHSRRKTHRFGHLAVHHFSLHGSAGIIRTPLKNLHAAHRGIGMAAKGALARRLPSSRKHRSDRPWNFWARATSILSLRFWTSDSSQREVPGIWRRGRDSWDQTSCRPRALWDRSGNSSPRSSHLWYSREARCFSPFSNCATSPVFRSPSSHRSRSRRYFRRA